MENRLYLAPLQGFTDIVYRNASSELFHGFDIAIAPFISALPGGRYKKKELKDVLPESNTKMPVIPQIMSNDPYDFAGVANKLHTLGYSTVNWNLGCPYKMVANKKRGSGLLCHPETIEGFLDTVFGLMSCRLSVKIRLGRHDETEIYKLLPIFNKYPIEEVMIHPRTGIQMYKGHCNLDIFEDVCQKLVHPVVYNGDIRSVADFNRLKMRFSAVDRWMIGRGALFNPFIADTIQGYAFSDPIETLRNFHRRIFDQRYEILNYSPHTVDRMKSFWVYFSEGFTDGKKILKVIKQLKRPEIYRQKVEEFFDSKPQLTYSI